MELLPELIFLGLVINRFVEWIKSLLSPANEGTPEERRQTALILGLSFVLGALAMIFVFPTRNMFPEAVSPLAGLIFTGILVGGVANGWDFTAGFAEALKNRAAVQVIPGKLLETRYVETPPTAPHDVAPAA